MGTTLLECLPPLLPLPPNSFQAGDFIYIYIYILFTIYSTCSLTYGFITCTHSLITFGTLNLPFTLSENSNSSYERMDWDSLDTFRKHDKWFLVGLESYKVLIKRQGKDEKSYAQLLFTSFQLVLCVHSSC